MSTGVVTIPAPTEAAPAEPEVANIGGDQPPMEYTPIPSAVKVVPRTPSVRPSATPPPHSNPVVRPQIDELRTSEPPVVPSVSLPPLPSTPPSAPSSPSTTENPRGDIGA